MPDGLSLLLRLSLPLPLPLLPLLTPAATALAAAAAAAAAAAIGPACCSVLGLDVSRQEPVAPERVHKMRGITTVPVSAEVRQQQLLGVQMLLTQALSAACG
jgi:hypothetical protein